MRESNLPGGDNGEGQLKRVDGQKFVMFVGILPSTEAAYVVRFSFFN